MEGNTEEKIDNSSLITNKSSYVEICQKYKQKLNSTNRKESSYRRKKDLATLAKRLKDYKEQNKGLIEKVKELQSEKAANEKKIFDLEKNVTTLVFKNNAEVQDNGKLRRQNKILEKLVLTKEAAFKNFAFEFHNHHAGFDVSTSENLRTFLARQEQNVQPIIRANSRTYEGVKQNYLDYQEDMDLSRITEYTEHGTPYDNQRSLLPNNNFFPQSNEQPNVYANLDQTNGSLNYNNSLVQLTTADLNQSSSYNQLATTSHRNIIHQSSKYNNTQSNMERTNPEDDSMESSFMNKKKNMKKRRKNNYKSSSDGSGSESSVDADAEDTEDEEKRQIEYENDDPELRDLNWAPSSDEELMTRDLGLERKISFMLQDWDVIQTPVVEKQVQVSICLISSSDEDEVEVPSPQQSAKDSPKAEAAAKSELTLKFNTDERRIYRCKNLGYDLKTFVRMDSSKFAQQAMPSFEEYLTGDSDDMDEEEGEEESVEESEDESVVSSFGEVDQSEFDVTPHKTGGSELEEASEDEQTEQANVNDETLNTSVEAGNLMDVTTENDLTNALNADSTIGKYESEPEDDVNVTRSENQSDQENLSTKADNSNIEESSKSDSSIVEESSKADNSVFEESMNSADDGDELDNTRQVFANDLEPDNDDCNLDDHKADQTNDNEDLNTNLCDTKDETVVLNSPDQQNLGETFDATDVQLPTNNEDNSTCLYEDKKNEQDSIPDISSGCVSDENVKETEKFFLNQNVNITKDNENDDTCLPTESLDEDNIDNAPQVSERKEDFLGVSEEKQKKSLTTVNKMDMPEQHEITNRDSTTSSNAKDHTNLPINTSNVTRRSKVKKPTTTKRLTEENRKMNNIVIPKNDKAPVADLTEKQDQEVVDEDASSSVTRRKSSRRSKAPTKYKDYFESKEKDEDVSENLDFVGVASPETSKSRNGLKSTQKRSSTTTNASEPKSKRQKEVGSSKSKNEESLTPNRRSNRIKAMTPSKLSSKSDSETLKDSKPNSKKRRKSDIFSPSSKKVNFKTPPKVQRDPLIIYTKRTPRPSIKILDSIESAKIETQQNKEDKPTKVNKSKVTNQTRNKKASGLKNKIQRATIKKKPASSKTTPRKSKVDKKSEVNSSESDDKKFTPSRFAKSKSKSSNITKKDSDSSASNTPFRVKKKNDKKPSSSKAASSAVKSPSQQSKKKNLKRSDKNSAASSNNKTKKSGVKVSVKDSKATTSARDRSKSLKRKTEEKTEQNNLNSSSSDDMPLLHHTRKSTSSLTSKEKKKSTTSEIEIRSPKPPVAIKRSKRSAAKKPVNYVAPSTTQKVRRGDNTYKNN